jgi:hypothetical protein
MSTSDSDSDHSYFEPEWDALDDMRLRLFISRQVILRGCRWIIDDESKINVVNDPWIYNGASKWVCAPLASGLYHMHVNDLTIEDMECQMLIN